MRRVQLTTLPQSPVVFTSDDAESCHAHCSYLSTEERDGTYSTSALCFCKLFRIHQEFERADGSIARLKSCKSEEAKSEES